MGTGYKELRPLDEIDWIRFAVIMDEYNRTKNDEVRWKLEIMLSTAQKPPGEYGWSNWWAEMLEWLRGKDR